jgi:hypothetical protein
VSWHGEMCEPCGECRACRENAKAKRERSRFRALLRSASNALTGEISSYGPDEIRAHPILMSHKRIRDRIDKWTGRTR